ncbi:MAG: cyclase family protein [Pyrinomonadaceae bacterium]|nr:cyclase family protein [Pyrinomonadaceae bacterium]
MIQLFCRFPVLFGLLSLLTLAGCEAGNQPGTDTQKPADSEATVVDLSYDFSKDTVYWVTAKQFEKETVAEGETEAGFYYSAYNYSAAEHGGTHIDSPIHFAEGKLTVDKIPLEKLMGPAVMIDVSEEASKDRNYLISIEDIEGWEKANGEIAKGTIILFRTGFGAFYPDAEKYLGTANRGDDAVSELSFPGLDPKAAKWLVENRSPNAVGLDTASIDHGPSKEFAAHVALMTNDIPAFENVANLDKLPAKGFRIIALPMKIKDGSGAPVRIVALVENG